MDLFKEFSSCEMVCLIGSVVVISKEHLLVVLVGPEPFNQNNVWLKTTLFGLQVHKFTHAVQLLIETHFSACVLQVSRLDIRLK
jgi:hypothetical protein